jgi:hypothetical protein
MKTSRLILLAAGLFGLASVLQADDPSLPAGATKVPLIFRGGHETDPVDRGRPVILIAAALGVKPEIFREAFSHVHPAGPGEEPQPAQVQQNKQALLSRLAPYGVTNDRLDEVSNYYRYRRESGQLWRHVDAEGFATVAGSKILSITITKPGAGYSSPPMISLQTGLTVFPMAIVSYGKNLATNGSIAKIVTTPIGDDSHPSHALIPNEDDLQQAPPTSENIPENPPARPPPPSQ